MRHTRDSSDFVTGQHSVDLPEAINQLPAGTDTNNTGQASGQFVSTGSKALVIATVFKK